MKLIATLFSVFFFALFISANAIKPVNYSFGENPSVKQNLSFYDAISMKMTVKEFQKATGKHLTFKQAVQYKAAQKLLSGKKHGESFSKGLYIVLAIFGWAWILMGIKDDWSGNNWWLNLLLTFLCWLPGLIHSLMQMKNYTD